MMESGADGRVVVEAERDSAGNAALARPIWADDHVEMRAGTELNVVVGDKVV
jgi:hypothetical protein